MEKGKTNINYREYSRMNMIKTLITKGAQTPIEKVAAIHGEYRSSGCSYFACE